MVLEIAGKEACGYRRRDSDMGLTMTVKSSKSDGGPIGQPCESCLIWEVSLTRFPCPPFAFLLPLPLPPESTTAIHLRRLPALLLPLPLSPLTRRSLAVPHNVSSSPPKFLSFESNASLAWKCPLVYELVHQIPMHRVVHADEPAAHETVQWRRTAPSLELSTRWNCPSCRVKI